MDNFFKRNFFKFKIDFYNYHFTSKYYSLLFRVGKTFGLFFKSLKKKS